MSVSADHVGAAGVAQPARPMSAGWVLKRALLGFAILFVTMGAMAWLTYASIDPDLDSRPSGAAKTNQPLRATEASL